MSGFLMVPHAMSLAALPLIPDTAIFVS